MIYVTILCAALTGFVGGRLYERIHAGEPETAPEPSKVSTRTMRTGNIGPKQLEWCKRRLPHFRAAKRSADRVIAEAEASRHHV